MHAETRELVLDILPLLVIDMQKKNSKTEKQTFGKIIQNKQTFSDFSKIFRHINNRKRKTEKGGGYIEHIRENAREPAA